MTGSRRPYGGEGSGGATPPDSDSNQFPVNRRRLRSRARPREVGRASAGPLRPVFEEGMVRCDATEQRGELGWRVEAKRLTAVSEHFGKARRARRKRGAADGHRL